MVKNTISFDGPIRLTAHFKNINISVNVPKYDGPYEVAPKAYEATELETKDKLMVDNVVVFEVPYHEVDNGSGNTVYIG